LKGLPAVIRSFLAYAAVIVGILTLGADLAQVAYQADHTARTVVLARS
jgi:hypothetical protein